MLLIPIGRDESEIRRHAWVSYVLIALNILVFVAVETSMRSSKMAGLQLAWQDAISYLGQHPYLTPPPEMERILGPGLPQQLAAARRLVANPPPPALMATQQAVLDRLASTAVAGYRRLPLIHYGYVPAEGGAWRMLTSMFIHTGFLHLIGNLLFFFLSGPFVEDVFGRPLFAFLYISGGIAAALTYVLRHPDGTIALVGASGAIAAVMGAYFIRFFRSKVEFLFVPLLYRPTFNFRFFLPAFVVLPLWFVQQFFEMAAEGAGGGVAFSAHVGGFLYGVAFAFVVRALKVEEKYVDPAVAKETTWTMDPRVTRALAARSVGDVASAKRELQSLLREQPKHVEALRVAVDVALQNDEPSMLDSCATRLLSVYLEQKQNELALDLIHELQRERLPKFLGRAAAFLERTDRDGALALYEELVTIDPNGPNAVPSLVKLGTLLRLTGDVTRARAAFDRARAHPACTAEWAPTIDAKLAQLGAAATPSVPPSRA
ncbi:MAG: rhomboid family intramembrane serine protease [Acidobacteria bacterium]|nr:rhomboid family intramembrane serine protease [Acidobacteriota bacterium]MBV9475657.1 rhomboid family intramembrane serine protease [Acidobacteriota bacterium]